MAFTSSAGFPGGNSIATSIALGDVDGDGRLDVVVTNSNQYSPNQLLLQQSDGRRAWKVLEHKQGLREEIGHVLGRHEGEDGKRKEESRAEENAQHGRGREPGFRRLA